MLSSSGGGGLVTVQCYNRSLRGWRNTVEIVLFEISNSMNCTPLCFTHMTSTLRPMIFRLTQEKLDEVSNRSPPTSHLCLRTCFRRLEVCHRRCAAAGVSFSMLSLGLLSSSLCSKKGLKRRWAFWDTMAHLWWHTYDGTHMMAHPKARVYGRRDTVNPQTKNLDFRGLDSNRFSIFRGGSPRSIGSSPKFQVSDS